jgi:hypothetical protein
VRGSGELLNTRFNLGIRYIPAGVIRRATLRTTLMYRLTQDLQLGVEYNPLADEVGPLANYRAIRETPHRPALSFGTSSDRIGTPRGRAYYATLSKDVEPYVKLPMSVYFSSLYGTFNDEWVFPFGANFRLGRHWTFSPQFDGHAAHGLLTYSWDRYSVTGMLVRWRYPGVAFNVGF